MTSVVLDTSVIIKWFHQEPDTARAELVRRAMLDHALSVRVPDLIWYEVPNVLVWKAGCSSDLALDVIDLMSRFPWWVTPPSPQLISDAAAIAAQYKTSVYDATFVALALSSHATLITADQKLIDSIAHPQVVHLKDFALS